jgi:hypothetical protein
VGQTSPPAGKTGQGPPRVSLVARSLAAATSRGSTSRLAQASKASPSGSVGAVAKAGPTTSRKTAAAPVSSPKTRAGVEIAQAGAPDAQAKHWARPSATSATSKVSSVSDSATSKVSTRGEK